MSSSNKVSTVAIAGLTGKLGTLIATHLLKHHPSVTIHGIVRNPSKVEKSIADSPNVKLFQAEFDDAAGLVKALQGVDVAICTYLGDSTLMEKGQYALIDACIAAGVSRYFASDYSFDYRGLEYGDHPLQDPPKRVAAYLDELEKKDKIKAGHVLIGILMETAWRFLGLYNDGEFKYYGTGEGKWEVTTYADTAAFTAEAALKPGVSGYIPFVGDTISTLEMAKQYEDTYGRKPKVTNLGTLEEQKAKYHPILKAQPENVYAWMADAYAYWVQVGRVYVPTPLLNEQYPQIRVTTTKDFLEKTPVEGLAPPQW